MNDEIEQAFRQGYLQGKKDAVKHSEWIFQGRYDKDGRCIYHCRECNFEVKVFPYMFTAWRTHEKYCASCGAIMDDD